MRVVIVLGSIRHGRQSHKAGVYLQNQLLQRKIETEVIDLAEASLPPFGTDASRVAERIKAISKTLAAADALVFVSPEYHGSFSGTLKNALDYFWSEFQKKPIGVVTASAGKMGGINASTQLQHVILSLGAYPLPLKFLVPEVQTAFDESLNPVEESLAQAAEKFIGEFLWFAQAIAAKKTEKKPVHI